MALAGLVLGIVSAVHMFLVGILTSSFGIGIPMTGVSPAFGGVGDVTMTDDRVISGDLAPVLAACALDLSAPVGSVVVLGVTWPGRSSLFLLGGAGMSIR